MTLVDSSQRQLLFELTKAPIRSLLELNEQDFGQSDTIRTSVSMLARALLKLRNLGEGQIATLDLEHPIDCPFCDTKITRLTVEEADSQSNSGADPTEANQWYVYCGKCSLEYTQALDRLSSQEFGFGVAKD